MTIELPLSASYDQIRDAIEAVQGRCRVNLLNPQAAAARVRALLLDAAAAAAAVGLTLDQVDPHVAEWPSKMTLGEGTLVVVHMRRIEVRRGSTPTYIAMPGKVKITIPARADGEVTRA